MVAWIVTMAVPVMITYFRPLGLRSLNSQNPISLLTFLEQRIFPEEVSQNIGLDWEICLEKTICEAHRDPRHYGNIALPFLWLFG